MLVGMTEIILDRNYREVTNVSFVFPELYINMLKTKETLQFWDKMFQLAKRG